MTRVRSRIDVVQNQKAVAERSLEGRVQELF